MRPIPLKIVVFFLFPLLGTGASFAHTVDARNPGNVDSLVDALKDRNSRVRETAAKALGDLKDPRAVDPLLMALGDPLDGVRDAAAASLTELGEPLGELIHTSIAGSGKAWEGRAGIAREELARRRDPRTLPPVVKALGAWSMAVQAAAAKTLAVLGDPQAVDPLIQAMGSGYMPVREAAAWALFRIGDRRAVDPMIKALGDGYDPVRVVAAYALGRFEDRRAVDPLVRALEDWYAEVRAASAWSLGKFADPGTFESLLRALGDNNATVREPAAWSLGRLRNRRAVDPLLGTLRDESPKVREAAVRALGELGDRRAVDPIVSIIGDADPNVRKAAAQVLDGFGEPLGKLVSGALEGSDEAVLELAGTKDPRIFDPLIRSLGNPDGDVRRAAAAALGTIGDRRAVDGLVDLASGWNLSDRVAGMSALLRVDLKIYPDLAAAVFRVACRPASATYLSVAAIAAVLAMWGPGWIGRARTRKRRSGRRR